MPNPCQCPPVGRTRMHNTSRTSTSPPGSHLACGRCGIFAGDLHEARVLYRGLCLHCSRRAWTEALMSRRALRELRWRRHGHAGKQLVSEASWREVVIAWKRMPPR